MLLQKIVKHALKYIQDVNIVIKLNALLVIIIIIRLQDHVLHVKVSTGV